MTELIGSFSTLISIVIAFVGVLGTAYFVYGAYLLMMSGGNASKAETGKSAMIQALIGVALTAVAFTVVNTLTSSIGSSGGAVQVGQVAGTDSVALDQPRVVSVAPNTTCATAGGRNNGCTLTVTFSEPVTVIGNIGIRIQNQGTAPIDDTKVEDTNTLTFHINNGANKKVAPDAGLYIADKFVFSRGARIRDSDNNNALYAFQPVEFKVGN